MSELAELIRSAADGASNRQVAKIVGVSPETINRIMRGIGTQDVETLDKIAHALRISVGALREAAGMPRGVADPYEPPPESRLLDDRQRRALDELIRSIVTTAGAQNDNNAKQEPRTQEDGKERRSTSGSPGQPGAPIAADKAGSSTAPYQGIRADDVTLAARRGESEHERQQRLEPQPEDEHQGHAPDGGA